MEGLPKCKERIEDTLCKLSKRKCFTYEDSQYIDCYCLVGAGICPKGLKIPKDAPITNSTHPSTQNATKGEVVGEAKGECKHLVLLLKEDTDCTFGPIYKCQQCNHIWNDIQMSTM